MNTTAQAKRIIAVGRWADNEWDIVTATSADALPPTFDAYSLGYSDAIDGKASRPGIYGNMAQSAEYEVGYRDGLDTLEMIDERDEIEWRRMGC